METQADIETFLSRSPFFADVPHNELETVACESDTRAFPRGTVVLAEDGPPSSYLYVIRSGFVELLGAGDVFATLEAGETFGHLSLLTRMPPTATVRAGDDAVCYLVPSETARRVLALPTGSALVSAALRERLGRRGHSIRALPEAPRVAAGLVAALPLTCSPETTIRDAARAMTDGGSTAIVV